MIRISSWHRHRHRHRLGAHLMIYFLFCCGFASGLRPPDHVRRQFIHHNHPALSTVPRCAQCPVSSVQCPVSGVQAVHCPLSTSDSPPCSMKIKCVPYVPRNLISGQLKAKSKTENDCDIYIYIFIDSDHFVVNCIMLGLSVRVLEFLIKHL